MGNLQVIYIAGSGRSGSTLLDRILGTLDGVSSFNETYWLFVEGFAENNFCACGERFRACPFWRRVVEMTVEDEAHARHLARLHEAVEHSRSFPRLFTGLYGGDYAGRLREYRAWLGRLYGALAEVSGDRIIVDSSKVPTRALILHGVPGIDVHVVHVVRDVRAVVYAWEKKKFNPADGKLAPIHAPTRTVRFWYARNLISELLGARMPYVRLRYEDFVGDPQRALQGLVDRLGPTVGKRLDFLADGSIRLERLHSIGGNPDRFATGDTRIRLDDAWREGLRPETRRLVNLFAAPLLARYGYPLSPDAGRPRG